jgi:hypothetical protein
MKNPGLLINYLHFLRHNDTFDKLEIFEVLTRGTANIQYYGDVRQKHIEFSNVLTEVLSEIRKSKELELQTSKEKPVQKEYDKKYFMNKIGADVSNFPKWREKGFFKNEIIISERKRKLTIEDINEFLKVFPKYRRNWEQIN